MKSSGDTNISAFDLDQQWIAEHYEELAGEYAEEWIAVKGGQVIAHNSDLNRLLSQVPDPDHTCIEFIEQQTPHFEKTPKPAADIPDGR